MTSVATRELIVLRAWDISTPRPLTSAVASSLTSTGLVECIADAGGLWKLRANSRVGVALGGSWELRVLPRIGIRQLMLLLSHLRSGGWIEQDVGYGDDDFFASVADGFSRLALRAVSPVPISGYEPVESTQLALRGRLRMGAQIAARGGLAMPLEVAYDEFSANVPENQLVLGAVDLLLRWPRVSESALGRLLRIRARLDGVVAATPQQRVSLPALTHRNARYRTALRLAQLILEGQGPSSERGDRISSAFSVDLNQVFEWFVGDLLADCAAEFGLRLREHDPARELDEQGSINLQPDFVLYRGGDAVAVFDAKFKRLASSSFPNADAYQLLAYCTAYGLRQATLIYAQEDFGQPSRRHQVVADGPRLFVEALDLTASPDAITNRVRDIVRSVIG